MTAISNDKNREIDRLNRLEDMLIPEDINYQQMKGLSNEVRQKLIEVAPRTIGQASRISGVTPAAVSLLLVNLKKRLPDGVRELG